MQHSDLTDNKKKINHLRYLTIERLRLAIIGIC